MNPETTNADQVVAGWEAAGVGLAVGLDDPQSVFASLRRSGIRTVIVHDERSGAFMADGYARASGRPAVAAGISGPGATNLITGLAEAHAASAPLVAAVGEARGLGSRPAFQEMRHDRMLEPVTKAIVDMESEATPEAAGRRSVTLATTGRPGPVLLLADTKALWESGVRQADAGAEARDAGVLLAQAAPQLLERAIGRLSAAQRPVIVAGNGVHISGATAELTQAAEAFDIPVATTLLGKGAIAEDHRLCVGVASGYNGGDEGHGRFINARLAEADLVLAVGTDLDPVTTSNDLWPAAGTDVIRLDVDAAALIGLADIGLLGDAKQVLLQLRDSAGDVASNAGSWTRMLCAEAESERARLAEHDRARAAQSDGEAVWPGSMMREIAGQLADGDAVVTDASYSSAWALDRIQVAWAGRTVLAPRGVGVLGWGLPAALGAKLARPSSRVTCITGDGGLLFSLGELETAVREGLAITLVLLNNGAYGFQRDSDRLKQGIEYHDLTLTPIDWPGLVSSFGWDAVQAETLQEFADAYKASADTDNPTLIDVTVGGEMRPPLTMFSEAPQAAMDH